MTQVIHIIVIENILPLSYFLLNSLFFVTPHPMASPEGRKYGSQYNKHFYETTIVFLLFFLFKTK